MRSHNGSNDTMHSRPPLWSFYNTFNMTSTLFKNSLIDCRPYREVLLARNSPRFPPSAYSISKNIFLNILKRERAGVKKVSNVIFCCNFTALTKKLRSSCMQLKRSSAIYLMTFYSTSWTVQYLESACGTIYCAFYFIKIIISEKLYYLFEVPSKSSQRKVRAALPFCANVHFEVRTPCAKNWYCYITVDSAMAASQNGI